MPLGRNKTEGSNILSSIWAETAAHWTMLLTEQCCSGKLKMILNEDEETILKKPHKTPTLNTN